MLALLLWGLWFCPLKINLSSSMPMGLYWPMPTDVYHRGDWVAVCLPIKIAEEGLRRGYLSRGRCASGSMPVLKMIMALPHDQVILTSTSINVNGTAYWAPHQLQDHSGCPVHAFMASGHYRAHGYGLYGVGDVIHSWDSRYYGGIESQHIIGRYRLMTQNAHDNRRDRDYISTTPGSGIGITARAAKKPLKNNRLMAFSHHEAAYFRQA